MPLPEDLKKRMKLPVVVTRPEILLCPNVPKPMHGVAPRVILGENWWNETRKKAYEASHYRCVTCGVLKTRAKYHQWLEGHEIYDIDYARGRMVYFETVALCHFCHNYIHDGRLNFLLAKGKVHHAKYNAIIQHGDAVLALAGLSRRSFEERELEAMDLERQGKIAPWAKWRLVLNGKLYPPKYKSFREWIAAFKE